MPYDKVPEISRTTCMAHLSGKKLLLTATSIETKTSQKLKYGKRQTTDLTTTSLDTFLTSMAKHEYLLYYDVKYNKQFTSITTHQNARW
ncbi:hypothetical protein NSE_0086 [Neorickettsia sennetsu str. Miyayama]|uniref:Uncharacterized protein n=1 Tax=Ehrlichia sennetsu (strain ATCC VR-367 / Miyayama) TaxID=222891 RepID=Q2GEV9_EHRS3|nr:hypothetical protein NSE_0086 [Neorickettsia sennetsu str. Miyayama]